VVARWLGDSSRVFDDAYALTELIQWVWQSRVRKGEPIKYLSYVTKDEEAI
jgi:hypothetical protein